MFIAGGYTSTYDSNPLGQMENGLEIEPTTLKELIRGDKHAEAVQDAINQGMDLTIAMVFIEWDTAEASGIFEPYGESLLAFGQVGRIDKQQGLTAAFLATAVSGPPAENSPASWSFPDTILHENFPVRVLCSPKLRKTPMRLRTYPNDSGVHGTMT